VPTSFRTERADTRKTPDKWRVLAEPDPTQPIPNWQAALGGRNRRDRPSSCPSGGAVDVNPAAQALQGPCLDGPATAAAAAGPAGQCI
jgi:hypothetical protein